MIGFLNFIVMLVWAFAKLAMATLMLCVTIIVLKPTLKETAVIVASAWDKIASAWEEVAEMERNEYGD